MSNSLRSLSNSLTVNMYFAALVVTYLWTLLVFPAKTAICLCQLDYSPVCGTDGETYGNKCSFECTASASNGTLKIAKYGEC